MTTTGTTTGETLGRPGRASPRAPGPSTGLAALHLAVLTSFAVAQPLFDVLRRDAPFFISHRSGPLDLGLFALGVTLLPALPPVACLLAARCLGRAAARSVQLVWVGLLVGIVFLPPLRAQLTGAPELFAVAAALGGLAAWLYARWPTARGFVTLLAPAPLVFVGLFLATPGIAKLLKKDPPVVLAPPAPSAADLLLVVFDELPTGSLLDEGRGIDGRLFPAFADLARHATWYRNASASHGNTVIAVPAILTGLGPDLSLEPLYRDHPRSVFTLLGATHTMHVTGRETNLCPAALIAHESVGPGLGARLLSLGDDSALVYAHIVLPRELARRLPAVTRNWGDFRASDAKLNPYHDRARIVDVFLDSIRPRGNDGPSVFFLHLVLPHVPWVFHEDGRRYRPTRERELPGVVDEVWDQDQPWLTAFGLQRHLLQAGYTDRVLGRILARWREVGRYDESMIVVMADHGVSFVPGHHRRDPDVTTARDIMHMPLLVKLPGQTEGRVDDRNMQSVDVLPTIAEALGTQIPWPVDGVSALSGTPPETKLVMTNSGDVLTLSAEPSPELPMLATKRELFGEIDAWSDVYAMGPRRDLVGRPVDEIGLAPASGATASIEGAGQFAAVDPTAELVPTFVEGRVHAEQGAPPPTIAVAVDGVVRAVVETFDRRGGTADFAALVPPDAFVAGRNAVELFELGARPGLAPIAAHTYRVLRDDGGEPVAFERSDGTRFPIEPGRVLGNVGIAEATEETLRLSGFASDVATDGPAAAVLLMVAGSPELFIGSLGIRRPVVQKLAGEEHELSGFRYELPLSYFGGDPSGSIRAFALGAGAASELSFSRRARWVQAP